MISATVPIQKHCWLERSDFYLYNIKKGWSRVTDYKTVILHSSFLYGVKKLVEAGEKSIVHHLLSDG